jgi:hypothetical protein
VGYYKCKRGHVFQLSVSGRLLSVHLGFSRFGRCPVDGGWSLITKVRANDLTEEELQAAHNGRS